MKTATENIKTKLIQRDLKTLDAYKAALDVLSNLDATKEEVKIHTIIAESIGASGYNRIQNRLSKYFGYFERHNTGIKEVSEKASSMIPNIKPTEVKVIALNLIHSNKIDLTLLKSTYSSKDLGFTGKQKLKKIVSRKRKKYQYA